MTKAFGPLEEAGLVRRGAGKYRVIDEDALGRLLVAAADLDVSAKRALLQHAQAQVPEAEQVAAEVRKETES